jgi:cytochrome c oxidase accessory protein FixG
MDTTTNTIDQGFRDSIQLVDKKGHRNWIFPRRPKGKFYNYRSWFSWGLLIVLFALPYIKYKGYPFFLLNILERKFIIFGIPFWPQDLPLFALLMITFVVFIIVFTVLFGRLFCGWACPQTIFMEMVFRKIEYWIEGDYKDQIKLNNAPWSVAKAIKKVAKHSVFFLISFAIANTFLAYLISADEVLKLIHEGPMLNKGTFVALIIFTGVFYTVFAFVREIVCVVVCPYGRLQGLMLDQNSIVVAYDNVRGEPRGFKKKQVDAAPLGDCIDCHRCVQVCPTGIDIRNGTQLECINCTACIDECDDVMTKIHKPTGLIRYASKNEIVNGKRNPFTIRSMAYAALLFLLSGLLTYFMLTRKDIHVTLLRTPGMTFMKTDSLHIANLYNFDVINKTFDAQSISIRVVSPAHATLALVNGTDANNMQLMPDDIIKHTCMIILPKDKIVSNNSKLVLEIKSNDETITLNTNFVGPVYKTVLPTE